MAALFVIARVAITQMSFSSLMVLKNVAYPEMEHYLTMKRYEVLMHTTTQMNFENIILTKISQAQQKVKHCIIPLR